MSAVSAVGVPVGHLDGLVALVTGGASGIGAAITTRLRADGARVAVLDVAPEHADADLAVRVDVTDDASVRAGVEAVVEAFGRLDIVVNNAGIGAQGDVAANDDAEWLRVLDLNVVGVARVTRAALPHLRRSPSAAICVTCSIAATAGLPQRALYSATKGALLSLVRAMAADHVREGIRVNAVSPGTVDTPWIGRLLDAASDPAAERAALEARQPHGRLVRPEEVADAVAYLVGPRAASTTGVTLAVDGGMDALRVRPTR
ncbi:SDR family NAD(P)-dependent oxidoreductase [Miniimonas arenae]|uniref:SDR family NAD(P)-dependent oxidoreductase n=1 Tax=Miniimonas arenae TaxID=676201 RepID=UPI001FE93CF8|nr:SDR family oxidoreductase [Miniimonas arenae]